MIKHINLKPLPLAERFVNNQAVILKNNLFVIINNSSITNQDENNQLNRRILIFTGADWKLYN